MKKGKPSSITIFHRRTGHDPARLFPEPQRFLQNPRMVISVIFFYGYFVFPQKSSEQRRIVRGNRFYFASGAEFCCNVILYRLCCSGLREGSQNRPDEQGQGTIHGL